MKGLENKLSCWVKSKAFGTLQVQHTEVPEAQQTPQADLEKNVGFLAQEQDLTKSLQTLIRMVSIQICIKSPLLLLRKQNGSSIFPPPDKSWPAPAATQGKAMHDAQSSLGLSLGRGPVPPPVPLVSPAFPLLLFGPVVIFTKLSRKLARALKMVNWHVLGWEAE